MNNCITNNKTNNNSNNNNINNPSLDTAHILLTAFDISSILKHFSLTIQQRF